MEFFGVWDECIDSKRDGIIYANAHSDEDAIALYERVKNGLACDRSQVLRLDSLRLRPAIQEDALQNNLIFKP